MRGGVRGMVAAVLAAGAVVAGTATAQACSDVRVTASVFAPAPVPVLDFVENVGFDGQGGLWSGIFFGDRIERLDPSGRVTATVPLKGPGAIHRGPDGLMYAVTGADFLTGLGLGGKAGLVRFDPAAPRAVQTVAAGLGYGNGGDFDDAGNFYISQTFFGRIAKVHPDGRLQPAWTSIPFPNGLEAAGPHLYVSQTLEPRALTRMWLSNPASRRKITSFGWPVGTDDLTLGPDGRLYVAIFPLGQLVRVDPATGATCTLHQDITSVSSARFAGPDFGPHAGDLFLSTGRGVVRLDLAPR